MLETIQVQIVSYFSFSRSLGSEYRDQCGFLVDETNNSTASLAMFYTKQELVMAAVIEICLAVLGTCGNLLVCVAVLKNSSLQIAANFYMVSLATADLLVTSILVPTRAAQNIALFNGGVIQEPIVRVLSFTGRMTILASPSSLAALTNDRRVALKNPLKYRSVIRYSKLRAIKAILAIWMFSLIFTSLPLIPQWHRR